MALTRAIEAAGLDVADEKVFETYAAGLVGEEGIERSVATAITKMPYDFSPARTRCSELAGRLFGQALLDADSADSRSPAPGTDVARQPIAVIRMRPIVSDVEPGPYQE